MKNIEKIKNYKKEWYKKNKDRISLFIKEDRKKNPEKYKKYKKQEYLKNKKEILCRNKEYRLSHKEKIKEYSQEYRLKKLDILRKQQKKWRLENREELKSKKKKYYLDNRENLLKGGKRYKLKNKEWNKEYNENYRKKNKDSLNKKRKDREKFDLFFKISCQLRKRFWMALKKGYKSGSAVRDLGCSIEEFKKYIELKFQEGTSWENWGYRGWHLDHIIPLANFNLSNRNELLKAVNYTNLQPLWAIDNLRKNKY